MQTLASYGELASPNRKKAAAPLLPSPAGQSTRGQQGETTWGKAREAQAFAHCWLTRVTWGTFGWGG